MSLLDDWGNAGQLIHDALEQQSGETAELKGRTRRMEVQWLELQGEIRATMKRIESQNQAILSILGTRHG